MTLFLSIGTRYLVGVMIGPFYLSVDVKQPVEVMIDLVGVLLHSLRDSLPAEMLQCYCRFY